MASIFGYFTDGFKKFFEFLLKHFARQFKALWKAKTGIPARYLVSDFFSVLRSVGMFAFLNLVAFVVFAFLPQGKDVLLIIAEDISRPPHQIGNLVWLLVGVIFWSVASEFGSRYAIYVTDNTLQSISDQRIKWRKAVQQAISEYFLLLPYLIVTLGFLINYLQDTSLSPGEKNWGFGIPVVCLFLVFRALAHFYYDEEARAARRKSTNAFFQFMLLPEQELKWCNMLFGIYNRYVYTLYKPCNFQETINDDYQRFCGNFLHQSQEPLDPANHKSNFPQDATMLEDDVRIPAAFTLEEFTKGENDEPSNPKNEFFKWRYKIPLNFYPTLHKQLHVLVIASLVIFLLICFLPISAYAHIGAPGLIVVAFGCWSGIYVGLLYMDYARLRYSKVSLRFILFVLLIFSSWFNDDHPIRYNSNGTGQDNRPTLQQHFTSWLAQYQKDSLETLYSLRADSAKKDPFYPVVFVCAEGGALRTGAFAAQTLSFLQDSIRKHCGIDIKKSVYAYSGVSGGSVGISYFNAAAYLSNPDDLRQESSFSELSKTFFTQDYLSPVVGKMFYAEVLQLFIPIHINTLDRSIALEQSWEDGFEKVINANGRNIFSADYRSLYQDTSRVYPAVFVNTTEAESGFQCWLTNVKMADSPIVEARKRDLMAYKIRGGINYSTMVNFSSRFPLFSPAGTLIQDKGKKFHYIDGGYVENTGCGTMLEVLRALEPTFKDLANPLKNPKPIRIKPFVFILKYNQSNNGQAQNISIGNEFSEVIYGIYNTRNGRTVTANQELINYVRSNGGETLELPLQKTGSEVPMNWVLSTKSLEKIEDDIKAKWDKRNVNDLRKFFAIDSNKFVKQKNWYQSLTSK
jgi:hypothetical protein